MSGNFNNDVPYTIVDVTLTNLTGTRPHYDKVVVIPKLGASL